MMKTTLEIPDETYREAKSAAALRGESVNDFVIEAIRPRPARVADGTTGGSGWRRDFGKASSRATDGVDRVVEEEFGADLDANAVSPSRTKIR